MTTLRNVEKKCAICGKVNSYTGMFSTNAFGSPDLDTRPPEMQRSTINLWIQTCPNCGYSAPDISQKIPKSEEIVYSDDYRKQLNSSEFPKLANSFLCYSLIIENLEEYSKAGWACLHASWVCDDAKYIDAAKICRKKSFTLFMKAKMNGQKFTEQLGAEEAIMVDVLRRAGEFEKALEIAEEGLKKLDENSSSFCKSDNTSDLLKNPEEIIKTILKFQIELINKKDVGCYTVEDAVKKIKNNNLS
jgi:tetratricopeptide (TPR) repeat protein